MEKNGVKFLCFAVGEGWGVKHEQQNVSTAKYEHHITDLLMLEMMLTFCRSHVYILTPSPKSFKCLWDGHVLLFTGLLSPPLPQQNIKCLCDAKDATACTL